MGFVKAGASAIGRLLIVASLGITFVAGMVGVFYLSLTGNEIEIPKIVGKNFNDGQDELVSNGLRIKKIATRYSQEKPNTILEQRPRAGTTAKTGLVISVVVSKENPDATEAPADVKEDEDDTDEIEELPELKTDKPKKVAKKKKKPSSKTRDVIEDAPKTELTDAKPNAVDPTKESKKSDGDKSKPVTDKKKGVEKSPPPKITKPKPTEKKKPVGEKKP